MRVLIFSMHFFPEIFRINDIAKSICNRGHIVDVVTGKPNYPFGKIFPGYRIWDLHNDYYEGVNVYRLPIFLRRSATSFFLIINYISYILSGIFFTPYLLRKKKYDVIFCYATSPILQVIPAILMARVKSAKLILNVQDLWPHSMVATGHIKNKLIIGFVQIIVDWIYANSDLILIQSQGFRKYINNQNLISKIHYWPNSVDLISDAAGGEHELAKKINKDFSILFTGNLGRAQNIEVIINAASYLQAYQEIKFWLIGDGSEKKNIEIQLLERKLTNVVVAGHFPASDMPIIMDSASVLLVTLSDSEIFSVTLPNKIQAYLAAGKPILGAINGEAANLIRSANCGLCVNSGDSVSLANAIIKLYKMPADELSMLGINSRKYYDENFNHEYLIEKLINYFKN